MCLRNVRKLSLTWRLALWYAGAATLLGVLALGLNLLLIYTDLEEASKDYLYAITLEMEEFYAEHGLAKLEGALRHEAQLEGTNRIFFRIVGPAGQALATTSLEDWPELPDPRFTAEYSRVGDVQVYSKQMTDGNWFQTGEHLTLDREMLLFMAGAAAIIIALLIICGLLAGFLVARQAMRGVKRVTTTANEIRHGNLEMRVPSGHEGLEIEELAEAFNQMLDRIQELVGELKDVTDNVAHDMRSPLTRIGGIVQTTLTGEQTIDEYREMAIAVLEENNGLKEMINTMLDIAAADAGVMQLERDRIDLNELAGQAYEIFSAVAEDRNLKFELKLAALPAPIYGDRRLLQRALSNLIDNAIKYTADRVEITVGPGQISVGDNGPGIPSSEQEKVFERFYRCEKSRTSSGHGLGLSLVRSIMQAHGGQVQLESGPGCIFSLIFE